MMVMDFERLYEFHGHRCPMSTMGARLGIAAMSALGATKADQFRVRGVYRSRNCALDGIQFVTGCTLGNGNLDVEDAGMAAFSLVWREGGGGATATVSGEALARFSEHKRKKAEYERDKAQAGPDREKEMEDGLKREFDALVEWVQETPDDKLLVITLE